MIQRTSGEIYRGLRKPLTDAEADRELWAVTALSAALQILHAPEVEAVLSEIQRAALRRIDEGYTS